jgi:hypothetical protein
MKKKPEPKRAESLPAFLASHAEHESTANAGDDAALAPEEPAGATADPAVDATFGAAAVGDATAVLDDGSDTAIAEPSPAESATAAADARAREARPATTATGGGAVALLAGAAALLGAAAAMFVPSLAAWSSAANVLFVLGAVLCAIGASQRGAARMQARLDEAERRRREETSAMQQHLQLLVDDKMRGKAPAEGEELQHVLMALQRQDEKINNLTRAIKMYGKPLMEISGQGTEVASAIAAVKAIVEGSAGEMRQAVDELGQQLRAAGSSKELTAVTEAIQQLATRVDGSAEEARTSAGNLDAQLRAAGKNKEIAEVGAAIEQLTTRLEGLGKKGPAISLEPLEKHLGRVEVAVAAIAQRLEDSEVRKSLLRLEEATQKGRDAVQQLLRGDAVKEATTQLQGRVDAASKGLADGIAKLRDGNLGGLESAVREIQREVTGVATTVSQINAAMRSGARVAAAPAPAPAGSTAPAPAATAPAASSAPAAAPGAARAAAPAGEASYSTGTRTSGAKNVLGAIAKLKQMKG